MLLEKVRTNIKNILEIKKLYWGWIGGQLGVLLQMKFKYQTFVKKFRGTYMSFKTLPEADFQFEVLSLLKTIFRAIKVNNKFDGTIIKTPKGEYVTEEYVLQLFGWSSTDTLKKQWLKGHIPQPLKFFQSNKNF